MAGGGLWRECEALGRGGGAGIVMQGYSVRAREPDSRAFRLHAQGAFEGTRFGTPGSTEGG